MPAACCVVRFHTCAVPTTATSDSNIIIKSSRQVETFSDFYSKKREEKPTTTTTTTSKVYYKCISIKSLRRGRLRWWW